MLPRKLYTMPRLQHWKGTQLTCLLYLQISPQSLVSFLTVNHCFPAFQKLLKSSKIDFHLFLWPFFLSLSPSLPPALLPTSPLSKPQVSCVPSWPHYLPNDDLELLLLSLHLGGRTSFHHNHHQTHSLHCWGSSLGLCAWSTSPLPLSQIPSPH